MNMYMNRAGRYYVAEQPGSESDIHIVSPRPALLAQIRGGESVDEMELARLNEANANGVIASVPGQQTSLEFVEEEN
jgi:hypothetical protein